MTLQPKQKFTKQQVLDIVITAPGLSIRQIADTLGAGISTTRALLRALIVEGKIVKEDWGTHAKPEYHYLLKCKQ